MLWWKQNKKKGKAYVVLILMKFSLVENININWIKNIIVVFLRLQNSQKFLVWLVEEYIRTTVLRKPIQHYTKTRHSCVYTRLKCVHICAKKSTCGCSQQHYLLQPQNSRDIKVSISCCCSSAAKSCQTFCDPKDCSTPDSSVLHYFPEFAQNHVHWVGDAI